MANDPVVILGTIDTENLKKSIDTLVSHVEQSMQKIAGNVDTTIGDMKRKLEELKNIDVGNKANSGSNQRSQNLKNEVQDVNNAIQSYDKLGQAVQKAAEPKSARESFFAFHRAFKEQAQGIATQIREAEAALNRSIENRVSELNAKIEKSKEKIHGLQLEITKAQMKQQETGNFSTFQPAITRAQQEMEIQLKRIADLKRQIAETPTMMRSSEEAQRIARLREEHERVSNIMKEEVTTKQQDSVATRQQMNVEKQKTEELQKQAQELKKQTELKYGSNFTLTAEQLQVLAHATSLSTQELQRFLQTGGLTSQELQTLQGWLKSTSFATAEESAMLSKLSNASKENAQATAQAIEMQRQQGVNGLQIASNLNRAAAANQRYTQSELMIISAIEKTLSIQREQVNYVGNVAVASYDKLSAALKQATAAYNQMGAAERNSTGGQRLLTYIHELQRELQLIQAQARRPINLKEALGNPENTLENITYKLQQLRSYLQGLDLSKQKNEIKQVSDEITRLEKKQNSVMGATRQWTEHNNALTRSLNYMKNRLAFVLTIGGTTQLVKQVYEIRSEYELLERSIGILIDSAKEGSRIFYELNAMAIQSPFTTMELGAAAKQLTAYDVAAKDVVNTTKRLADMAAAVGVPIDRLTYALGQIKAYGYLNTRDARMFANAGIPLVKQLSDYYTALEGRMVSVANVYDRIKKKAISYNDVMQVVNKMTDEGGKFFNYQERVAGTMKVQLANLSLAWNNMLNQIGKSNQALLTAPIKLLKILMQSWKGISNVLRDAAIAFGLLKVAQIAYVMATERVGLALATVAVSGKRVTNVIQGLSSGFSKLFTTPLTWWMLLATMAVSAGMAMYEARQEMEAFNRSVREAAQENSDNITRFLKDYNSVRESLYDYKEKDGVKIATPSDTNIVASDAQKAWEAMREQIELSSGASSIFLERLDNIENINERLRTGFDYVDKILAVSNAMKEISGDTLDIGFDYGKWYTLWLGPEGLVTNTRDYASALKELGALRSKYITDEMKNGSVYEELNKTIAERTRLEKEYKDLKSSGASDVDIQRAEEAYEKAAQKCRDLNQEQMDLNSTFDKSVRAYQTFNEDIQKLYDSAINLANVKGWFSDPDMMNEMFGQIEQLIVNKGLESGWTPEDAFTFQMEWEEKRSEAAKQATETRLNDEINAYQRAEDEKTKEAHRQTIMRLQTELSEWDKHNGRTRAIWKKYCEWMKNEHISEVQEMFRGMSREEIEKIDWSEGKWKTFAESTAAKFAREHNISYDTAFRFLQDWVKTANTWEIIIGLTISTEDGKGVYDALVEADQKVEDSYNRVKRLQKRLNQLRQQGKTNTDEYKKAQAELKSEQERGDKARAEGGESRSETSDSEKQQRKAEAQRKKDEAARKKAHNARVKADKQRHREAQKAAHQAESELQKTLREEMQIIDRVQKAYNDLAKAGLPHDDALKKAISGFDNTVSSINDVLKKWGLETLDLKKFAGIKNPKDLYTYLEKQLKDLIAAGKAKPEERLELETKIRELKIEVEKYNMEDVSKGIQNALTDIKEQYDLAIQLDEQPELSGIFTKLLGITDEELKELPKDAEQLISTLENIISDKLLDIDTSIGFTLSNNLSKADFDTWVSAFDLDEDSNLVKSLDAVRKWINDIRLKEIKTQIDEWDKLLSKYSEYEYKRTQIMKKAEKDREVARKKGATKAIIDAINNREKQDLAELDFNEFQKSPEWITATGDLANMTRKALLLLIDSVKDYKDEAKNMTPKQITKINTALRKLYKQLRKGNPWHAIGDALDEAKARAEAFDPAIKEVEERIKALQAIQEKDRTPEQQAALDKLLERLQKLKDLRDAAGKINVDNLVEGIQGLVELVSKAAEQFQKLATAIGGENMTTAGAVISGVAQNLTSIVSGAAIGAVLGGATGALVGGISFGLIDIVSQLSDIISGNKKITKQVEASEREVKNLDNAYKRLQYTVEKSLGAAETSARRAAIANKELQLVELKRQLQLEQSRKKKNQDEDKMADLAGQIIDLEQEIENLKEEVVNNLLGEDIKAAAEGFVDTWVSAWKEGEDTMKAINDSFDTMINTMIKKAIASTVIAKKLQPIYDAIDAFTKEGSEGGEELTLRELDQIIDMTDNAAVSINEYMKTLYAGLEKLGIVEKTKDKSLSNLQQGISSVTEETANAVEAYLNSMSQQAYLRNDYLRQIVTMMQGMDLNITTGVQAQMLFTMQQSYQLQQSMYSLMDNWTVPAGNGLRVELIN